MAGHIATSKSVEWNTPEYILKPVREFFGGVIHLDPCSNANSTVGALASFMLPVDGLQQTWNYPTIFVNPPYGRDKERGTSIADWVAKGHEAHLKHKAEVIQLIPAAVDTKHWQDIIFEKAAFACFLRGRVKFAGKAIKGPAPMACALVGFTAKRDYSLFSSLGYVAILRKCHACSNEAQGQRTRCGKCLAAEKIRAARARQNKPEVYKAIQKRYKLKKEYGMTEAQLAEMLQKQNGLCAICQRPPKEGDQLNIDHNHETGLVRELLCTRCNTGLGFVENEELLRLYLSYLDKHEKDTYK